MNIVLQSFPFYNLPEKESEIVSQCHFHGFEILDNLPAKARDPYYLTHTWRNEWIRVLPNSISKKVNAVELTGI